MHFVFCAGTQLGGLFKSLQSLIVIFFHVQSIVSNCLVLYLQKMQIFPLLVQEKR